MDSYDTTIIAVEVRVNWISPTYRHPIVALNSGYVVTDCPAYRYPGSWFSSHRPTPHFLSTPVCTFQFYYFVLKLELNIYFWDPERGYEGIWLVPFALKTWLMALSYSFFDLPAAVVQFGPWK